MSIWGIAVCFKRHSHIWKFVSCIEWWLGSIKKRKKEKRGKEEEVVVVEGWLSQVTSPSNKDTFSHWIENMLESLGTSPF